MIISILLSVIIAALLVYPYKKREEIESKLPTKNVRVKQFSVVLGLVMCFTQLVIPAVEGYWFERPHVVAGTSDNVFQVTFTDDWKQIQRQWGIDPKARLDKFKVEYQKDGQITRLSYNLVGRLEDRYVNYDIVFSADTKTYTIKRSIMEQQWLPFDESVFAERYFEVLDGIGVHQLSFNPPLKKNILISEGERTSYAIEDRQKFVIKGDKLQEVQNDDLPIEAYLITSCAKENPDGSFGCERIEEYFFDVAHENEAQEK